MHHLIQSIQEHETITPHCIRITGMDCPVERVALAAEFRRALPAFDVKMNPAYPSLYLFPKSGEDEVQDYELDQAFCIEHAYVHPQATQWKYDFPFFMAIVAAFFALHLPLNALLLNAVAALLALAAFVRFRPKNIAWHLRGLRRGWPTPQLLLWSAAALPVLSLPLHLLADSPATHLLDGAVILFAGHILRAWQSAFFARHLDVGDPRGHGENLAPLAQFFVQALLWLAPIFAAMAFSLWMFSPSAQLIAGVLSRYTFLSFGKDAAMLLDTALQSASALLLLPPVAAILLTVPALYAACLRAVCERGIVCDSIQTLAMLDQTRILALRRGGIITKAQPKVKEFVVCGEVEENEALGIASALEANAEHPYAEAICAYARRKWLETPTAEECEETPGMGVSGMLNERRYYLGGENYISTLGVNTEAAKHTVYRLARSGDAPVLLADEANALGVFAIGDSFRPNIVKWNKALLELGVTPVLLTHRNRELAKTVADQCAMVKYFSGDTPDDLSAALRIYQKERVGKTALLCLHEPHKKLRACVDVVITVKTQGEGIGDVSADVEVPDGIEDVLALLKLLHKTRYTLYGLMSAYAIAFVLFAILAVIGVIPAIFAPFIPAAALYGLHIAGQR